MVSNFIIEYTPDEVREKVTLLAKELGFNYVFSVNANVLLIPDHAWYEGPPSFEGHILKAVGFLEGCKYTKERYIDQRS